MGNEILTVLRSSFICQYSLVIAAFEICQRCQVGVGHFCVKAAHLKRRDAGDELDVCQRLACVASDEQSEQRQITQRSEIGDRVARVNPQFPQWQSAHPLKIRKF